MGFKMRRGLASDKELEEADKRAYAREADIRRPSREKEILADAALSQRLQEERSKSAADLLEEWRKIYCEEARRRYASIFYETYLFLEKYYELGVEDKGEVPLKALRAVSKSITRAIAMYCQLLFEQDVMFGKLIDQRKRLYDGADTDRFKDFSSRLKGKIWTDLLHATAYITGCGYSEREDSIIILESYINKKPISKVVGDQLKRNLDFITTNLDLSDEELAGEMNETSGWSTNRDDLTKERRVLEGIFDSPGVVITLLQNVLEMQEKSGVLMKVTGPIFLEILTGNLSEDKEGDFSSTYSAAVKEHAGSFKEPPEDWLDPPYYIDPVCISKKCMKEFELF